MMRKAVVSLAAGAVAVLALSPAAISRISRAEAAPAVQSQKAPAEPLKLKVGDTAPDFTLLAFDGEHVKPVSLHDFKGKKSVALAFYVFAFTGG